MKRVVSLTADARVVVAAVVLVVLLVIGAVRVIPPVVDTVFPSATMDGLTWRKVSIPILEDLRTVVGGGPGFVAGGPGGVVTSTDGTSWSQVPGDQRNGIFDGAYVNSLVATGGRLYAGGRDAYGDPRVWISSDGLRWRAIALPVPPQTPTDAASLAEVVSIAAGPGGFVAVGNLGRDHPTLILWYSAHGDRWQLVSFAGPGLVPPDDVGSDLVAAGDHGYAAVLNAGASRAEAASGMLASADGQRWTPTSFGGGTMTALTSDRGGLLAGALEASNPVLWRSDDGLRWSALGAPPARGETASVGNVGTIARDGGVLWAAGSLGTCVCPHGSPRAAVWASRDGGQHWSALPDPHGMLDASPCRDCQPSASISAMAAHDGVVVAVGADFWAAIWRGAPG